MIARVFRLIVVGLLGLVALVACAPGLAIPAVTANSAPTAGIALAVPTVTPTSTAIPMPTTTSTPTAQATTPLPVARVLLTPTPTRDTRPDPSQHTIAVIGPPPTIPTMPAATPTAAPSPSPTAMPSPSPTVVPAPAVACAATLQACIVGIVGEYEGSDIVGVAVTEDGGTPVAAVNADRVFATASLYKLFVLWGLQRAIADGDLSDSTLLTFTEEDDDSEEDGYLPWSYGDQVTVAEARELMITASSNSAAWLLANTVGWDEVDALLHANGFPNSFTVGGQSTPREIAAFFDGIINRSLDPHLRASDYSTMLELLRGQLINDYLSTGFPSYADFAHKTGNLPGVINDAGILFLPNGRAITLTVMTEGDEEASFALMQQIAAAVWEYYER